MTTRSLQHARDLLATLVLRDLKLRYKRSLLGVFWTLLHPLAQLAVLFFVFRTVLRVDVPHYAAFLFIGITVWTWLAGALVQATSCVLDDRALIRRPAFPAAVLPVASVTSHAVHFLLTLPVTLGLLACEGRWPGAALGWHGALLLAGVVGEVPVELREPHGRSRDHTERMLRAFGYSVEERDGWLELRPGGRVEAFDLQVPGDPSSAAFLVGAAVLAEAGELCIAGVGVMDDAKPLAGTAALGIGALAIGNVKYQTQQRLLVRNAAIGVLIEDAGLGVEQRDVAAAGAAGHGLAHLTDHVVVDGRQDFRPERRLGDVGVDVDEEIVLIALGLTGRMREDVARVRLHGDFLHFAELRRHSLEHGVLPRVRRGPFCAGRRPHHLTDPGVGGAIDRF